ncbi:MAG: hypothetical protein AABZ14_02935, partial [Candidatus Margulisiibacteriota bacterium]
FCFVSVPEHSITEALEVSKDAYLRTVSVACRHFTAIARSSEASKPIRSKYTFHIATVGQVIVGR